VTDERAVSVPVQYVLLLATLALLSSGLFVAMGGFVESEHSDAARDALEAVGQRLSADIAAADRLATPLDGAGEFSLVIDTPATVAGTTYTIAVERRTGDRSAIVLEATRPPVVVDLEVVTDVTLVEGSVSGGQLAVVYDPLSETLEVRHA